MGKGNMPEVWMDLYRMRVRRGSEVTEEMIKTHVCDHAFQACRGQYRF